jgi:hypothetical protein
MKNIVVSVCLLFLAISINSCNKTTGQTNPLTAKWNIINDSLSDVNLTGTNYIGKASDYFDFTANGTLYIKEDSLLNTATYSMVANDQVDIVYILSNGISAHRTFSITNLTAHSATLTLSGSSLGPAERQIINLKK